MSSDFDDCSVYVNSETPDYTWQTHIGPKALASRWLLAATAGAYSQTHIDAAGDNTYIHIAAGSKKWALARKWPCHPTKIDGWEDEKLEWEAIYLEAGDDLYVLFRCSLEYMV